MIENIHRMNLFHIWSIQKIEQVYAVPTRILPASGDLNFFSKNTIHSKKVENLHANLDSQV